VIERTLLPGAEGRYHCMSDLMFRITPRRISAGMQENVQAYVCGGFLKLVCDKRRALYCVGSAQAGLGGGTNMRKAPNYELRGEACGALRSQFINCGAVIQRAYQD
jgi:hypothetical protein